jgi:tyrosine-protein phosphatase YwqE
MASRTSWRRRTATRICTCFGPRSFRRVARLNEQAQKHDLQIVVLPGSEIALYNVKLYRHNYSEGRYCHLGDAPEYSLLEFPWQRDAFPRAPLN